MTTIADDAPLGDGQGAASLSRDGSVDWWCPGRLDAPSVFTRLLPVLLRRVETLHGEVEVLLDLVARLESGLVTPPLTATTLGIEVSSAAERLALTGDRPLVVEPDRVVTRFPLREGDSDVFALSHPTSVDPVSAPVDARAALDDTVAGWQSWSAMHQGYQGRYREQVTRSGLVLQALTYRPTGAVVAAATTSLAEQIGGSANWDDRFGRDYLPSKNMCWGALNRAIDLADRLGGQADVAGWQRAREESRAASQDCGWNEQVGSFTGAFNSNHLDAGSCSYLLAVSRAKAGQVDRTRQIFETVIGYAIDLGLLSEEIDASGGKIINTTSVHQEQPRAGAADDHCSNGALRNLTRTLVLEVSEMGMTVNNIAPGMVRTSIDQKEIDGPDLLEEQVQSSPLKRAAQPEEIDWLAVFPASSDGDDVTGATYVMDGGLMQMSR